MTRSMSLMAARGREALGWVAIVGPAKGVLRSALAGSNAAHGRGSSSQGLSQRFKSSTSSKETPSGGPRKVAVGIDLGTTNSCVAVMEGGRPKVISNAEGMPTTPSMVAYPSDGARFVGVEAKRQASLNPERTIFAAKRLIGRKFKERSAAKDIKNLPFKIVEAKNGDAWVEVDGKKISPSEVGSAVLEEMKKTASNYLGQPVTAAVITVPAYFDDAQRQATKVAGQVAGLDVLRIVNEPTAAALAFGMDKELADGKKVAVFDLGGGTFDVSILELQNGVFEVKATNGDTSLGGEDFDRRIVDFLLEEFKKINGSDEMIRNDPIAMQRIREAAVQAKISLSGVPKSEINIPWITREKHFQVTLTRAHLESLVADLVNKTIGPAEKCIRDAGLSKKEIDQILLVGGMTRMPLVAEIVAKIFGKQPSRAVNPDEAVALGAAIQAGILGGEVKDILLLDVAPISLGIETMGGVFTRLIERNTTVPAKRTQVFSTAVDNQHQVGIRVYQGERELVTDNKLLGQFDLVGIPPAPRGVPQIEVAFEIDANGIMAVSAVDKSTGKKQEITIQSSGGLTKDEIAKLVEEAETHREADQEKKELISLKQDAEMLVAAVEKQIKDFEGKVTKEDNTSLSSKIAKLQSIVMTGDVEAAVDIRNVMKELQKLSWDISKKVYAS